MMRKGIAFKTFVYTATLITLINVVSIGALCAFLPDYYLYSKEKSLSNSTEQLANDLSNADMEESTEYIHNFSIANNATVMPFDAEGNPMPEISSPAIAINKSVVAKGGNIRILFKGDMYLEEDGNTNTFFIRNRIVRQGDADNKNMIFISDNAPNLVIDKTIENGVMSRINIVCTLHPVEEAANIMISLAPMLLAADIIFALIAAYIFAQRLTKPILVMSDATEQMRIMTPGAASGINSGDELGRLSRNLDDMYTSLCQTIDSLRCETERARRLEQSKTDFLRAASHELKTPIAALKGITEGMIDDVGIYKDKQRYLKESEALIDKLTDIVTEILNASSKEEAEEKEWTTIDVKNCIDTAIQEHRMFIEQKMLHVDIPPFKLSYYTHKPLLLNTFSNIISNCVKYTQETGIIKIEYCPECRKLSIENQCAKLPEDELVKLFEPFYTRDYSHNKQKSGSGLGLYIVKRNLERLNLPYTLENGDIGLKFTIVFL